MRSIADARSEVVNATESGGPAVVEHAYREAVGELDRLYRVRAQWHDLGDLYEARLARALARMPEIADLRLKLAGDVVETQLKDLPRAIDQHELVISEGRGWERAVAALERLVVHEEHRERIALLLEPVYRDQDWWQKLVVILDAKLAFVHDPHEQVHTLHEIALIHEQRGGALDLALTARRARVAASMSPTTPASAKLLDLRGQSSARGTRSPKRSKRARPRRRIPNAPPSCGRAPPSYTRRSAAISRRRSARGARWKRRGPTTSSR